MTSYYIKAKRVLCTSLQKADHQITKQPPIVTCHSAAENSSLMSRELLSIYWLGKLANYLLAGKADV